MQRFAQILICWTVATSIHFWVDSQACTAGENYAFLVAVADYDRKELKPLNYTRADILEFQKSLIASGFSRDRITVLLDDKDQVSHIRFLSTATNIREQLKLRLSTLEKGDTVIVAFAGHGVQFKGDKESYYCPLDARLANKETLVSFAEVLKELERSPASQKLLLVDACRNDPQSAVARSRSEVDLESVTRPQEIEVPKTLLALFSCSPGQQSYEFPEIGHGIFFHHVLKAWNGEADRDQDGKLDFSEFESYVRRGTKELAIQSLQAAQVPQLKGELADEWVLRKIAKDKLTAGSLWVGDPGTQALTILDRDGEKFRGRFVVGTGIVREVNGTIADGKLSWLAKDVKAIRGSAGGNNSAVISGDKLDFRWVGLTGTSGTFTLQHLPKDNFQVGSIWAGEPAGWTLEVLERNGTGFRAHLHHLSGADREVSGNVSDGLIFWKAADVKARKGSVGGDNYGAIRADRIDFEWSGPGEASGKFTLFLQKPSAAPKPTR